MIVTKIKQNGSVSWTTDQSLGGNRVYMLGDAIDDTDAVNLSQLTTAINKNGCTRIFIPRLASIFIDTITPTSEFAYGKYLICVINKNTKEHSVHDIDFVISSGIMTLSEASSTGYTESIDISSETVNSTVYLKLKNSTNDIIYIDLLRFSDI